MANRLLGKAIANILGGVTQQPSNTRFLNMASESINTVPSPSRGLNKRPGSRYVAKAYQPASVGNDVRSFAHFISRDSNEKYGITLYRDTTTAANWTIGVVDLLTGDAVPVYSDNIGTGVGTLLHDYLHPGGASPEKVVDAQTDIRMMTVGDTTFVLNRNRIAQMDSPLSDAQDKEALVVVRSGVYGQKYGVSLDGDSYKVDFRHIQPGIKDGLTVDGSVSTHSRYIGPDAIAAAIATDIADAVVSTAQVSAGEWQVVLKNTTGGTFKLSFYEWDGTAWFPRTTAAISYSSTAATLAANIDAALEAVTTLGPAAFSVAQSGAYTVNAYERFVITSDMQLGFFEVANDSLTGATLDWTVNRRSNVLRIRANPVGDFEIEPLDANYGNLVEIVRTDVEALDSLPVIAPDGFKVRVKGTNDDGADDWYAEFTAEDPGAFGRGSWQESIGWEVKTSVDATTMPHVLRSYVKSSVGTHPAALADGDPYFVVEPFVWADRVAGDDTSNPVPSIFDKRLDGMGFYRGRLLLMTGESVVASEAGAPGNLFRIAVASLLDSDRIDLTSQVRDASDYRAFVELNEKGILFSDNSQIVLDSAGALLTPSTAGLQVAGSSVTDPDGGPIAAGRFIFAPFRRGYYTADGWTGYSGVYQLVDARGGSSLRLEPFDITDHIPQYIEGRIVYMTASTTENLLAVLTEARDTIYLYRWQDSGDSRIQSAWQKIKLAESYSGTSPEIRSIEFLESSLFVSTWRDDEGMGLVVERIDFSSGAVDDDFWCSFRLDSLVRHDQIAGTTVVLSGSDTLVTFPAGTWKRRGDGATGVVYAVLADVAGQAGGTIYQSDTPAGGAGGTAVVKFPGVDLTSSEFYIGVAYTMRHTLSQPYIEKQTRDGSSVALTGKTHVARAFLDVAEAADLKAELAQTQPGGSTSTRQFLHASSPSADVAPYEKTVIVPVNARSDGYTLTIINDSPFAGRLNGIEYELVHHTRSQRVG